VYDPVFIVETFAGTVYLDMLKNLLISHIYEDDPQGCVVFYSRSYLPIFTPMCENFFMVISQIGGLVELDQLHGHPDLLT
jgi:hypothetical protein